MRRSIVHAGKPFLAMAGVVCLLATLSPADIIDDVRVALEENNVGAALSQLENYRGRHGVDPLYLEAVSWLARAYLSRQQLDQAEHWAKQVETSAHQLLEHREFDAEPHLPLALGAALEVEAQSLALQGESSQAAALLRRSLVTYGHTSIRARLQKNLNLLGLTGQIAPSLVITNYIGIRPAPLSQLKGFPVLLFFWAHWCGDCKHEGPILSQLNSEFSAKGLKLQAPTQFYGYAANGVEATQGDEFNYIGRVWQHYYPGLQDIPVPVSKGNFDKYGASTTPTLVLIDRQGHVTLYHPGFISYQELRAAIERAM
ncbi:MAG TPA: TlpA disulfide reductase family protein [Terriglobales bacterium]|nr:TlpA disulfide reductase family protein [Terriglobales bacterium]